MHRRLLAFLAACTALLISVPAFSAPVRIVDDTGQEVVLPRPAQRIIALAPHVTEVLFAAGADERVVGVVAYSDYPEEATRLPQVGGYTQLDLEAVAALRPDLVVGWAGGNRAASLDKLRALGVPIYLNDPHSLDDVARSLEAMGILAGTEAAARAAAEAFRARRAALAERYASRPPVRLFYQVWDRPLMTVNGQHLISDAIRLCGGENVFADLPQIAPTLSTEAVLLADPEVILASGMDQARPEWLDNWRNWKELLASRNDNLYFVPPQLLQRHTPRLLDGAERMCVFLEEARAKRPAG
ncbi:cobalamin-binding protein [Pseudothauera nasutitermitis]|uniref:Cobalamin-binding protein n=2 Tax=Pseudothauera nasutitermitis TaxID=2565930 RepID=A0A4S4AVN9_9RHOO|nr:cobalamin-binding protein [Pseudothauera nasutitermitis]